MIDRRTFISSAGATIVGGALLSSVAGRAMAETGHLRIAMTAADVPTTTGMPNNGAEGMRFLGYPVFEPLVDWDLANAHDRRAGFRPGLATEWTVDESGTVWTFSLREGVKFHDGSDFDADVALWNFDRLYDPDAPHFDPGAAAIGQARVPQLKAWRKVDDRTIELETKKQTSYFPMLIAWLPMVSRAAYEAAGSELERIRQEAGRHRAVPDRARHAPRKRGARRQPRALEPRPRAEGGEGHALPDAGGDDPPRRPALGPG